MQRAPRYSTLQQTSIFNGQQAASPSTGTKACLGGVQVIALAERGTLYDPGPCMYMEKLAVGPRVDPTTVSLDFTVAQNLEAVSAALDKPVSCAPACMYYVCAQNKIFHWGITRDIYA